MPSEQAALVDEDGEEIPEGYFELDEIRKRLPRAVTGKQQRVAVCLVRNPDAPLTGISEATAVSSTTVLNTLKALVNEHGLDESDWSDVIRKRGGQRYAKTYEELTAKQKAVVDWLARHPGLEERLMDKEDSLTSEKVANAIEHDERYDVALHSTYPNKVITARDANGCGYLPLVEDRRKLLAARGDLEDEEAEVESLRTSSPRAALEASGWVLPEENLDSLEPAEALTEEERLELAYENAQNKTEEEPVTEEDRRQYSAPYTCPECRHEARADECPKCGHDKRYDWAKDEAEDAEEPDEDEREGEELTFAEEPLVQDMEAVNDALEGVMERLNKLNASVETLRSNAVMESEAEEILANFEERLQGALEEHKQEVREAALDAADDRLHNSLRADLAERVEGLEADLGRTRAEVDALADEREAGEGRLGLVIDELVELAGQDAEVRGMEVSERNTTREYVIKVSTSSLAEATESEQATATDGGEVEP